MRRSILLSTTALAIAILPLGAAEARGRPEPVRGQPTSVSTPAASPAKSTSAATKVFGGPVDGFMGGVLAGYNFHKAPDRAVMWGIEADVGFGDVTGNGTR